MINRRLFLAGATALALAGCETPTLVDESVSENLRVTQIVVDTSAFQGVRGREFSASNEKVKSDIERSLAAALIPSSQDGTRPVRVKVDVTSVVLVSPGQSLLIGGISTVNAQLTVTDMKGVTIIPTTGVYSSGSGYAPGGIIGAATRQSAPKDYEDTVNRFGSAVRRQIFGKDEE